MSEYQKGHFWQETNLLRFTISSLPISNKIAIVSTYTVAIFLYFYQFFNLAITQFTLNLYPLVQIIISILFVALFAQLSIDVPVGESSIPITGQTFAVLLSAYWLKQKMGTVAIFTYVLLGIIGLPIFADGKSGWDVLIGGSGGFLIGFIVAAYIIGYLGEKDWPFSFTKSLMAMILGTAIILFFGVGRLSYLYGLEKGLAYGFYPFWQGAIIKIILGAIILPLYHRLKN